MRSWRGFQPRSLRIENKWASDRSYAESSILIDMGNLGTEGRQKVSKFLKTGIVCCPFCHGSFNIVLRSGRESLRCNSCNRIYAIIENCPMLIPGVAGRN